MNSKQLLSAGKATIAAFVWIVLSTIYSEIDAPFKKFLAASFGHHWVGKGILSIVIFIIVYYFFSLQSGSNESLDYWKMSKNIVLAAVIGGLVILVFYLWEFFN